MKRNKRFDISKALANRIFRLMEDDPHSRTGVCGPKHDPYGYTETCFDVRSALGRFLTKRGWTDCQLGADFRTYYLGIWVHLERPRGHGGEPVLRLRAVAV